MWVRLRDEEKLISLEHMNYVISYCHRPSKAYKICIHLGALHESIQTATPPSQTTMTGVRHEY